MKYIFVIPSLRKGGAERVVVKLSDALIAKGHDVVLVLFQNDVQYRTSARIISLDSTSEKSNYKKILNVFFRVKALRSIFKEEKAHRVFSFTESCNIPSILTGCDVIVSIRNFPSLKLTLIQKLVVFITYRFSNVVRIVAVSKKIEEVLNKKYFLKNTLTIQNPVINSPSGDINSFVSSGFKSNGFWLAVGRLDYQKGFDLLIESYEKTLLANNIPLVIIGDGNERDSLTLLIKEKSLQNKVFLIGKRDDVYNWYQNCFGFILSSRFEGFPNVLIEALDCDAACIATNCDSGPAEIIIDRYNGILVDVNVKELLNAMDVLYSDSKLKSSISSNAKRSISQFNITSILERWLRL